MVNIILPDGTAKKRARGWGAIKNSRVGFTLVELSIVLVVIGLLIGGILVGQSLIESSQINSLVRKLQQFEIARSAYKVKYNGVAGDSAFFIPAGNGDGHLDFSSSGGGCIDSYSDKEYQQYWAHLSQAKMISQDFRPYEPSSCPGGSDGDYTTLETEEVRPIFTGNAPPSTAFFGAQTTLFEVQSPSSGTSFLYRFHSNISEGVSLDVKLDDGNNATGEYLTYVVDFFAGLGTCQEQLAADASSEAPCWNSYHVAR